MLPSTLLTGSASAVLWLSRAQWHTPHNRCVRFAPAVAGDHATLATGARYGLPGPVSHRHDNASFPGAQAIHSLRGEMDCFAALAMTPKHAFALATPCARGVDESYAQRGRGERRMPVATRGLVCTCSGRTHTSTTSTPESPDVPARNGFKRFPSYPGDRALLPPSPCGLKVLSSPVEPNEPPQDLTPASRRQDHTTSPSASSAVVLHAANRSRRAIRPALASHAQHCRVHRRVRDDHDTPLWWGGMATVLDLIWSEGTTIFRKIRNKGLDTARIKRPDGQITARAQAVIVRP